MKIPGADEATGTWNVAVLPKCASVIWAVAPVVAYKIHQTIAGSRFVVFERSGHLPFYEEPEAFDSAVEDFLQSK